jgi:ADP-ribose pyrophosphatase
VSDPIPEVIISEWLHDGFIGVHRDTVRFASGHESTIEVIEHGGGVALLAVDPDGLLLFVRQYRHPPRRWLLELPAGTIEPDEDPAVCANRELQEETGYRPGLLEKLGGFYLAPGYSSEYLHVFLATDLTESKLQGDEDVVHVERLTVNDALQQINIGQIEDAKTIAALLLYLHRQPK